MLSKEEIEKAKEYIKNSYVMSTKHCLDDENKQLKQAIETFLQYNNQLEQENKKLNKIIDEMGIMLEELKICHFKKEDGGELLGKYRCYNKEDWKQYFEKKVEEK